MITLHFHLQPLYKYELFHINFTFIEPSCQICQTMAFLSFIFLQSDWLVKKALKSDWFFCFIVPFPLAEKKMPFRAKDSAISE